MFLNIDQLTYALNLLISLPAFSEDFYFRYNS